MKEKEEMFLFKANDGEIYNPGNLYNVKRIRKLFFSSPEHFAVSRYHTLNKYYSACVNKTPEQIREEKIATFRQLFEKDYHNGYHGGPAASKEEYIRDRLKKISESSLKLNRHQKWILKHWPITIVKMTAAITKIEDCPEALI